MHEDPYHTLFDNATARREKHSYRGPITDYPIEWLKLKLEQAFQELMMELEVAHRTAEMSMKASETAHEITGTFDLEQYRKATRDCEEELWDKGADVINYLGAVIAKTIGIEP